MQDRDVFFWTDLLKMSTMRTDTEAGSEIFDIKRQRQINGNYSFNQIPLLLKTLSAELQTSGRT